jgi:hypothetical protein
MLLADPGVLNAVPKSLPNPMKLVDIYKLFVAFA